MSAARPDRDLLLALAAALLVGACAHPPQAAPPAAPQAAANKKEEAKEVAQEAPLVIPGVDLQALPPVARGELDTVLKDEFCPGGHPDSMGACLRSRGCRHSRQGASLAASWVASGASAFEVSLKLARYYGSFREPRAALQVDERLCLGSSKAPVTLVVFADFECPACARASPILEAFAKERADTVRLCHSPYPLSSIHPHAAAAAQAALWARDQGRFWEMHDALYEHQHDLATPALVALAERLGLPGASLRKALEAGTYAPELERSIAQGLGARIRSTPTLFINGRAHALRLTPEELARSVEDELEWSTHGNAWAAD